MSLLFSIIPKAINAFFSSWYKFKNFVVVENVLFYVQLFINSRFPFLILVGSINFQVLLWWPKHEGS